MKTVLIFVSTVDGKVTKWGDPHVMRWSSKEDQAYFRETWKSAKVIVIGNTTFAADPIKAVDGQLLMVMTREPQKHAAFAKSGAIEFTNDTPAAIAARFASEGLEQLLVVGGAHVATTWLKEQQIDEVWLTIEPKIFGTGGNFVTEEPLDVELQLIECNPINEQGTLLTKYKVLKKG